MERKIFSGLESIKYMAKEFRAQPYSISQVHKLEDETKYDKNKIVIGMTIDGDPFTLNLDSSIRAICIGKPGSGKTVLQKSFLSRFWAGGNSAFVASDIKGDEYQECSQPLQMKYHGSLLRPPIVQPVPEVAQGLPIKVFRPYFFTHFSDRIFKGQMNCQFNLESMTAEDFITISGAEEKAPLSILQKDAIEGIFALIKEGKIKNFRDMEGHFSKDTDIERRTSRLLLAAARQLESKDIIGNQFDQPNFTEAINQGLIPILNTYGVQFAGIKRTNTYASTYVAMAVRNILDAKASGRIKSHVLGVFDEMHRFCPHIGEPSSKTEILNFYRLSRRERISILASTQNYNDVPDELYEMSNYIFLPRDIDNEILKQMFKRFAEWDSEHFSIMDNKIRIWKRQMPKHSWFCFDKDARKTILMKPAMPLCRHVEEKPT